MRSYKPRKCAKCGAEFQPTAARQLCATCPKADDTPSKRRYAARTLPEKRADSRRRRGAAYDTRSCGEGPCAICGREGRRHWDHDHATGLFRGCLCINCNLGLGHFKDSVDGLKSAILYLSGGAPETDS